MQSTGRRWPWSKYSTKDGRRHEWNADRVLALLTLKMPTKDYQGNREALDMHRIGLLLGRRRPLSPAVEEVVGSGAGGDVPAVL